ncbi:hypothetical protein QQF64_002798 [Cirrhinus molitorella]|uniref:Homeobox domain-containing protein n=1 Tax=Cirrhinus molitorella TaxID=172907 RepID=A0ABR3MR47_9TELE
MHGETGNSPVQGKTSFSIADILDPSKFNGKHQETLRDIKTREISIKLAIQDNGKTTSSQDPADSDFPSVSGTKGKAKRIRTAFTLDQLRMLERSFQNSHYLSVFERHCIAALFISLKHRSKSGFRTDAPNGRRNKKVMLERSRTTAHIQCSHKIRLHMRYLDIMQILCIITHNKQHT